MYDALNIIARVDEKPGMMCSLYKFHGRLYRSPVVPYICPGRHRVKPAFTSETRGKSGVYGNAGNMATHRTAAR